MNLDSFTVTEGMLMICGVYAHLQKCSAFLCGAENMQFSPFFLYLV